MYTIPHYAWGCSFQVLFLFINHIFQLRNEFFFSILFALKKDAAAFFQTQEKLRVMKRNINRWVRLKLTARESKVVCYATSVISSTFCTSSNSPSAKCAFINRSIINLSATLKNCITFNTQILCVCARHHIVRYLLTFNHRCLTILLLNYYYTHACDLVLHDKKTVAAL